MKTKPKGASRAASAETETVRLSEAAICTSARPMSREEYVESIRDGREVYLYGDRVKDVATHYAFRKSVRMTARLCDALHPPKTPEVLTCPTDTGDGGYTMWFFRAIAVWDEAYLRLDVPQSGIQGVIS